MRGGVRWLVIGVLVVAVVVAAAGAAVWFTRQRTAEADKEARFACNMRNAAAAKAPNKTEAFVAFTLDAAATHARKAEELSDTYRGFGEAMAGMSSLSASTASAAGIRDVSRVNAVCGPGPD